MARAPWMHGRARDREVGTTVGFEGMYHAIDTSIHEGHSSCVYSAELSKG